MKSENSLIEINPSNYKAIKLLEKYKINELRNIGIKYSIPNYNKLKKQNIIEKIINTTEYLNENKITNKYNKKNINNFDVKDSNIKISMINSSYGIYNNVNGVDVSFEIDRKRMFNFIKHNTNLSCYYDNTQHQGVKINSWGKNGLHRPFFCYSTTIWGKYSTESYVFLYVPISYDAFR